MTVVTLETAPAVVPADPFDLLPRGAVVAVAMSGGVDSSVAAARCVARGVETLGITLALWPGDREQVRDRGCCSIDAVEDARRVANRLGIRHLTWNLEREFSAEVVAGFEDDYAAGRTPNPCVRCNQRVKFGVLLSRARAIGATHVATGHYARIGQRGQSWTLHRARETGKDQAYTLHRLDQAQLGAALFPLGGVGSKSDVRAEAARLELVSAAKPDSQELCFVDGDLPAELSRRLAGRFRPGPITDAEGRILGEHRGLPFYTVGQRSRLDIRPDRPDAAPLYVLELDAALNRLVVGPVEALQRGRLRADDCRWLSGVPPEAGAEVEAQLRAHGRPHTARVITASSRTAEVRFVEPAAQVSPGQAVVLYRGDEVVGGGVVEDAGR
jgi:tRNA-specific 2-thiouridylase